MSGTSFVVASALVAGAALALYRRRRRNLAAQRKPPVALFFGPAVEFCEPVRALLKTSWTIESASSDPSELARQAAD
eukprot:7184653-Prymnesium_polylepis.1